MEIWKDVIILDGRTNKNEYKGLYQISSLGRVKNIVTNKVRQSTISNQGYYVVTLHKDGTRKQFKVHRLVAMAFHDKFYFENALVDHKDTNKLNNHYENLRWCTPKQNINNSITIQKMKTNQCGSGNNSAKKAHMYDKNDVLIETFDCCTNCAKYLMKQFNIKLGSARTTISTNNSKDKLYRGLYYFNTMS